MALKYLLLIPMVRHVYGLFQYLLPWQAGYAGRNHLVQNQLPNSPWNPVKVRESVLFGNISLKALSVSRIQPPASSCCIWRPSFSPLYFKLSLFMEFLSQFSKGSLSFPARTHRATSAAILPQGPIMPALTVTRLSRNKAHPQGSALFSKNLPSCSNYITWCLGLEISDLDEERVRRGWETKSQDYKEGGGIGDGVTCQNIQTPHHLGNKFPKYEPVEVI